MSTMKGEETVHFGRLCRSRPRDEGEQEQSPQQKVEPKSYRIDVVGGGFGLLPLQPGRKWAEFC